jgi:hypothetical protein
MRGSKWAVPLIVAALLAVVPARGAFTFDDPQAIVQNPGVNGAVPWPEIFRRDFWGTPIAEGVRSYRPLVPLLWRALWRAWPSPLPFRLVNAGAHVLCVALLMLVAASLLDARSAWWIALLFAVHAVHAEAIGSIVAIADTLSTLLGLAALAVGLRARRALVPALLVAVACLAKESAFVFAAALALAVAVEAVPLAQRVQRIVPLALVVVADVTLQLALPRARPVTNAANNIAFAATSAWQRIGHGLYVIGRGMAMCFVPTGLAPMHNYGAVDLSAAVLLPYAIPGALVTLVGVLALVVALRRRSRAAILAVTILFGPLVIMSSLFVPVINELAERMLYPASAAAAALTVTLVLGGVRPKAAAALLVAICAAHAVELVRVERAWRSDITLWTYANTVEPRSRSTQSGYGTALIYEHRFVEAAWHRMIEQYLDRSYPHPVDWEPVERLEASPPDVRLIEGPGLLAPDAPCPFIEEWRQALRAEVADFADHVAPVVANRWRCGPAR